MVTCWKWDKFGRHWRHWIDNQKRNFRRWDWFPDDFGIMLIATSPAQVDTKKLKTQPLMST